MDVLDGSRKARFELATEAHRFILAVFPFRYPESENALGIFLEAAVSIQAHPAELNAILVQTLWVLDSHTTGRLPTLVERYLALGTGALSGLMRFRHCVDELFRYWGVRSAVVQEAIAVIHDRCGDSALSLRSLSEELDRDPDALGAAFKFHTGLTFHEYLRNARLDRAAVLLTSTTKRIKEIWVSVGYNDAANFDHDFAKHFGAAPRDYRVGAIRRLMPLASRETATADPVGGEVAALGASVLIVDDDEGVRETLGRYLRLYGYSVVTAGTGEKGLSKVAFEQPDVLLLDFHLPDVDGLEFLRRLRQSTITISWPAVAVMTADWDIEEQAGEIRALGATILSKPCFADEVMKVVRSLCAAQAGHFQPGFAKRV